WKELVPQTADVLQRVSAVGGRLFANYLHDAHTRVAIFDEKGSPLGDVSLPGLGSAGGFNGRRGQHETFFSFTGFTTPNTIYRLDVKTGKSEVFRAPVVDFEPSRYVTEQVVVTSKDGTR